MEKLTNLETLFMLDALIEDVYKRIGSHVAGADFSTDAYVAQQVEYVKKLLERRELEEKKKAVQEDN